MSSTHHIEVADWYRWDFGPIAGVGVIPRAGGLTVDYDELDAATVFVLELQPQLCIDNRDYAERVGNPDYRKNMPVRGESPSATNAMLPIMPSTGGVITEAPPAGKVY